MSDEPINLIAALRLKLRAARSDSCRRSYAKQLVRARHEAGEYGVQGHLPDDLFEGLVEVELRSARDE